MNSSASYLSLCFPCSVIIYGSRTSAFSGVGETSHKSLHEDGLVGIISSATLKQSKMVVLSVGLGTVVSASPGNLVEMQILRPKLRPTESETLGVRPRNLSFHKLLVMLMETKLKTSVLMLFLGNIIRASSKLSAYLA